MTLSVFFILLAFLGFSQVFSSVMTQVIERMFETIGLHSPTPDLGDTIERSWTMLLYAGFFGPITEEFFFRGAGSAPTSLTIVLVVAAESTRGSELSELVAHHRLGDENGHMLTAVVDGDGQAQEVRGE